MTITTWRGSVRFCAVRPELRSAAVACLAAFVGASDAGTAGTDFHTPPTDWEGPRRYHTPFESQYDQMIQLEREPWRPIEMESLSPNGAYGLTIEPADRCEVDSDGTLACFSQTPDVALLIDVEREHLLVVQLKDHYPNFQVSTRWISDKLLFVRVWWGRILGTDAVVDVERGEFLYREMVHDGGPVFRQHHLAE